MSHREAPPGSLALLHLKLDHLAEAVAALGDKTERCLTEIASVRASTEDLGVTMEAALERLTAIEDAVNAPASTDLVDALRGMAEAVAALDATMHRGFDFVAERLGEREPGVSDGYKGSDDDAG